jgi:hypothetical protein
MSIACVSLRNVLYIYVKTIATIAAKDGKEGKGVNATLTQWRVESGEWRTENEIMNYELGIKHSE